MQKININQNDRKEFLNWRMDGIGASDVAMILNKSPYGDRIKLFEEKTTGKTEDKANSFILNRGHKVEKLGRAFAELELGLTFEPTCIVDERSPHRRASLDGMASNGDILEVKYVGAKIFNEVNDPSAVKEKMLHYYIQIQWQLLVAREATRCHFCMIDSKNNKKIFTINKDLHFISAYNLISEVDKFWHDVSIARGGNKPTISTSENKKKIVHIQDDDLEVLLSKRAELLSNMKDINDQIKMLDENIYNLDYFKKGDSFSCGGHTVLKVVRKGSVDYKKIPELEGINLEIYRKPSTSYWKFS
jgi:putative phage-type endonuclease